MNLTVGQQVKVYDGPRREVRSHVGTVVKVGRTLAIVEWDVGGFSPLDARFRMEDGRENDGYGRRWIKTLEQAETDDRIQEARRFLGQEAMVTISGGSPLTNPQIEELAAIVKQMLSEKPADYESEVANGPQ